MPTACCYLCGSTERLTRDHLPPKGFYPPPAPNYLITVPCCEPCNHSYSKDDEAVRIFLTANVFVSPAGEWIFRNKVLGSSLIRSPKLRANVSKFVTVKPLKTPTGNVDVPAFGIPTARLNHFILRMAKGMISYLYPSFNYREANYKIKYVIDTPENRQLTHAVCSQFNAVWKGDDVYRYCHGLCSDDPNVGLIAFVFYGGSSFFIFFGHGSDWIEHDTPDKESI